MSTLSKAARTTQSALDASTNVFEAMNNSLAGINYGLRQYRDNQSDSYQAHLLNRKENLKTTVLLKRTEAIQRQAEAKDACQTLGLNFDVIMKSVEEDINLMEEQLNAE